MTEPGEIDINLRYAPIITFGELAAFVDMLREKGFPDDTEVQVEAGDKMHWLSCINGVESDDSSEVSLKLVCTPQDRKWWMNSIHTSNEWPKDFIGIVGTGGKK